MNLKWIKNLKWFNVIGGAIFVLANSLGILFFYLEFGELPSTLIEVIIKDYPSDWLVRTGHIVLGVTMYYAGLTKLIKSKSFLLHEIFILFFAIALILLGIYSPGPNLSDVDFEIMEKGYLWVCTLTSILALSLTQFSLCVLQSKAKGLHSLFLFFTFLILLLGYNHNNSIVDSSIYYSIMFVQMVWVILYYNQEGGTGITE